MTESNTTRQVGEPAVLPPRFVRRDERGDFIEVINRGPWETAITGRMRGGAVMGHHYHKVTRALFHLQEGDAEIHLVDVRSLERRAVTIRSGECVYLEPMTSHAIRFLRDSSFLLLKSRAYSADDPDTFPFPVELS